MRSATVHVAVVCALLAGGCRSEPARQAPRPGAVNDGAPELAAATFVGRKTCRKCHAKQDSLWTGSHHDLAMQSASAETVLGNFAGTAFNYAGITSRFSTREGRFFVRTDGPDGRLQEFEISHVFGVYPLQQYLVAFPNGRLQALGIAWDSRPRAQGGGRWFHLYPRERVTHTDVLHWTKFSQNWNAQCAACHSTNLQKNYDPATDSYQTRWSELDVSCEACHGPASAHVSWAERAEAAGRASGTAKPGEARLVVDLTERRGVTWSIRPATGLAVRSRPPDPLRREVEVCAPCHARRVELTGRHRPGDRFLDGFEPLLLTQGLYRADGQMEDEVYNYGSFLQSRMHQAGVTCADCHEPHSLKLRAAGNDVCAPCHLASTFDAPSHHFHKSGSSGAKCTSCHMTTETYMVVDSRHDHSFRIPRPDLSERQGLPNACTSCHRDKTNAWASAAIDRLRPTPWRDRPQFADAFQAGRDGRLSAERSLIRLAEDSAQPPIVRATAAAVLTPSATREPQAAVERLAADREPLVRLAITRVLGLLPPPDRARVGGALLGDELRAVRLGAAAALAGEAESMVLPERQTALTRAIEEYESAQMFNADRPESRVNLALLHQRRGEMAKARQQYEAAIAYAPWFVPAYVNLADLSRVAGDEAAAERTLRAALAAVPDHATVLYALGLSLVRQRRTAESVPLLARAASLEPSSPRFAFGYALALESQGNDAAALRVIVDALTRHPEDRDLLEGAVALSRKRGSVASAREYARRILALAPGDPGAIALARDLGLR